MYDTERISNGQDECDGCSEARCSRVEGLWSNDQVGKCGGATVVWDWALASRAGRRLDD